MHAAEGAVEVRRARRRLREAATDERVEVFTPDKDGRTHTSCGRAAVIAARRGTVCGEVGRVPRFPSSSATTTPSIAAFFQHIFSLSRRVLHMRD